MKRLLLIIILSLSFNSLTKADDIRDFEIEGISIGDSALDYFSKSEIKINSKPYFKNKKVTPVELKNLSTLNTYDELHFSYITKDKTYSITSIDGTLSYRNNVEECYQKMDKITKELKEFLKDIKHEYEKKIEKHRADKSGKSKVTTSYFFLDTRDVAYVQCFDYSDKTGWEDHLRVGVATKEQVYFLQNEAYK